MPRVEWLGVRLPSSNATISYQKLTKKLTRRQLEAIDDIDACVVALVRIEGSTQFGLGPADGLSKHYLWGIDNRYVEEMTDSDARILFTRMAETRHFKNLDDPLHRDRVATFPEPAYIDTLMVNRHGKLLRPSSITTSTVKRLLRKARKEDAHMEVIGSRIARVAEDAR